jgi:hypothetical protein
MAGPESGGHPGCHRAAPPFSGSVVAVLEEPSTVTSGSPTGLFRTPGKVVVETREPAVMYTSHFEHQKRPGGAVFSGREDI